MKNNCHYLAALTIISMATTGASAQDSVADLMAADTDTLRSELQSRFDAALTLTNDQSIILANDARYMWASEAKVQCAIALGYLKSNTRDQTSIEKCDFAFKRMSILPPPVVETPVAQPAPPPPPRRAICDQREPTLVFFEWDSYDPSPEATQTIGSTVTTARECGWSAFSVVGHTDRSGSNAYNDALSLRRAEAIANLMGSLGISPGQITISARGEDNPRVPTEDGVRSPQNRRVEVTVSN
ncbi:OmpA family protein [uncultured Erythrobacter sp.]|uniref:OmpA family protein n=1 Tax=uncultured Erythrobacter sp. TaxID=263913 RepID=UPI002606C4F8|nr:OmpA family protein [uncultured Erythrobacter sp.]